MRKFIFRLSIFLALTIACQFSYAQEFTLQDTLRGSITPERAWWDLSHYHLSLEVVIKDKYIKGNNVITYKVLGPHDVIQIDLQDPLKITKVTQGDATLSVESKGFAHFIKLEEPQEIGEYNSITVH